MSANVTLLLTAANASDDFKDCLDSILRQSYCDLRLIVLSSVRDNTIAEIIKECNDDRVFMKDVDEDVNEILNILLSDSESCFVGLVNPGDILHSEKLRIQIKRMEQYPDIDVCATWCEPVSERKVPVKMCGFEKYVENPSLVLLTGNFVSRSSSIVRKSFIKQHGISYDRAFHPFEEYKMWVDIATHGGRFFVEPQRLVYSKESDVFENSDYVRDCKPVLAKLKSMILERLISCVDDDVKMAMCELQDSLCKMNRSGLFSEEDMIGVFVRLLSKVKLKI